MVKIRWILLAILIFFGIGLVVGYIHINHDATECLGKKTFHLTRWQTIFAIGRYELRYPTLNFDCDVKYDPTKGEKPYVGPEDLSPAQPSTR